MLLNFNLFRELVLEKSVISAFHEILPFLLL